MNTVDSVETQKTAYDAVDGGQKIRDRDIKELVSQYGKLLGKDRIARVADVLSTQLTTVVGVETYNDFRNVTFEIYVDRCGVVMIDAALPVKQFGIPVEPKIDVATVDAIRKMAVKPLVRQQRNSD